VNNALPDLQTSSELLYFSAGVTRRSTFPGGEIYFRAAACTGALYDIELYLACGPLADLEAGLYHYAAGEFGLRRLRAGDCRHVLVEATAGESSIAQAPVIVICTGTYWRNAWKYQARTYRHFGWDNGTILANLLAMSAALEFPAKVICGFVDADVNRLLDVDTEREVAFSLLSIGHVADSPPSPLAHIPSLGLETVPLSKREVDYPAKVIKTTFDHRSTAIEPLPEGLKDDFGKEPTKSGQWTAFLRRARLTSAPSRFVDTIRAVREFAHPPLSAAASGDSFERNWEPGGSWSATTEQRK
jgi:SagB-type dehydrogenase family enzyme